MVECHYADHESTHNKAGLASVAEEFKKSHKKPVLITCHRIEHYGETPNLDLELVCEKYGITLTRIIDSLEAITRLTRIATGTKSEILGEWAILSQVQNFVNSLPDGSPSKKIGLEALRIARLVRSELELYAPDHATLLLSNIQQATHSSTLVVVGSGMLGLKLANAHGDFGYEDVVVVTRDTKSARKRLPAIPNQRIVKLKSLAIPPSSFDVVVASTNLTAPYAAELRHMIGGPLCKAAIDVSAVPALSEDEAITLYSPELADLIEQHNQSIQDVINSANDMIDILLTNSNQI